MKASARAHSNIALVKYWGKTSDELRLPTNSSVAVTLDKIFTETTVEVSNDYQQDTAEIDGDVFSDQELARISEHLDRIRAVAGVNTRAKVVTKNNFPKAVGAASSASGFAALTVAAAAAYGLKLSEKELSVLARQGSGSASRSIPGGISIWHKGEDSQTSFAEKIAQPKDWDLRIFLLFVGDKKQKKVSSTKGMALAHTSPYFELAKQEAEQNAQRIQHSMEQNNWQQFGKVIEDECYRLHTLCMTTTPNILYWKGSTVDVFQELYRLREQGVEGFFTVDAGPHVHVVCQAKDAKTIQQAMAKIPDITDIVECQIGPGAHVIDHHLF